jgi:hypothetical protein
MTAQSVVKQAFAEAEKEARDNQVAEVKAIVKKTLEKLETVRKELKGLQEKERILKMDIDDLKEGRLDRIAERQEIDPEAKKVSVVVIIKEKEVIREVSPWYWPYHVTWQIPAPSYPSHPFMNGTVITSTGGLDLYASNTGKSNAVYTSNCNGMLTCSVAKDAAIGAYEINGKVINLR